MTENKILKPTESELEILGVLWEKQAATVREVNDELQSKRVIGYTTTLKLMQIMFEKKILNREKSGKTHIYFPLISREQTQDQLLNKLLNGVFQGSAKSLVLKALGAANTDSKELEEIKKYLDKIENK